MPYLILRHDVDVSSLSALKMRMLKEMRRIRLTESGNSECYRLIKTLTSGKTILLTKDKLDEMRSGMQGFLKLKNVVSSKWLTVQQFSRK
jgi:hypothetical protein